ncbi:hypothetical protein DGN21_03430 [Xanthomonas sp. MLO165]|nr:hypothetical protein DGN21_03430 [Xanthomonas sp. MLO165]
MGNGDSGMGIRDSGFGIRDSGFGNCGVRGARVPTGVVWWTGPGAGEALRFCGMPWACFWPLHLTA